MGTNEHYLRAVTARRKGKGDGGKAPCTLQVGWCDDSVDVIMRTVDQSGRPPLVALLDAKTAKVLAGQLLEAAEKVEV